MNGVTDRPGWLLDELRCIGRENLDAQHVSRYDEKEDADAAAEIALLRSLGLGRDSVVVDLGAGTGQFALAAAEICVRVIAVDPSPVMRTQLVATARTRPSAPEIVGGGFLSYEHDGPPADFVYSRYALHHLPDFWKALALHRIRRMLRTGGVFRLWDVVYDFSVEEAPDRIESWCASLPVESDGWTRADAEEHVRDEHSTFSWILEPMLERGGFRIDDASYSDDGFFAKYVAVAA